MRGAARVFFASLAERFMEQIQVLSWSSKTLASYRTHLRVFADFITTESGVEELVDITPEVLFRYQTYLYSWTDGKGRGRSIATQGARLSTVRSFFRYLVHTGVLRFDPSSTLVLPKRKHILPRSILTKREVVRLLVAPDIASPLGLRDRAILEVLYSTGIRNAELRALKLYDLELHRGLVQVNAGKNGKDRVVPLGRKACGWVKAYLERARPQLLLAGGHEVLGEETLFLSKNGRPLQPLDIILPIRRYTRKARIKKSITPHTLRHTCATHMLAGHADLRHIQALLGHASIATTQIYTQVAIADLKAVHRRCHPREQRS